MYGTASSPMRFDCVTCGAGRALTSSAVQQCVINEAKKPLLERYENDEAKIPSSELETLPRNLIAPSAALLSNLTRKELRLYLSESFRDKDPEDQLRLFYRAIRGQEFLARQRNAISDKDMWVEQQLTATAPQCKLISKNAQDEFFKRLMEDSDKRKAKLAAAISDKLAKEETILKSSKLWGLSHKLCRVPQLTLL
eukprot:TRINITY_DN10714_c0_g1_i4.p2 TRINITY_DN10714_c0_g1~~TRINITY_DN10714_c0_g1_i4.p2  ORF type:complete len:196 (+),score=16.55 TRINITY_DN10714_c0_g1_i4:180-767(+)